MSGDDTGDAGRLTLCRRDGEEFGAGDDDDDDDDDDEEEECAEVAATGGSLVMSCES